MTTVVTGSAERPANAGLAISRARLLEWLWPDSGALNPIPALDGLRAIAVVLVLAYHAWNGQATLSGDPLETPAIGYGRTGVNVFFVLSGFLLFLPYARWIFGLRSRPGISLFYRRRVLRVCPAYWASLLLLVPLAPRLRELNPMTNTGQFSTLPVPVDALLHALFVFNAIPSALYSFNGVYWTMAVEVQFYAILPLLCVAFGAVARRVGVRTAVLVLIVFLGGLVQVVTVLNADNLAERMPLGTALLGSTSIGYWLSVFGAGMVCSLAYVYVTEIATFTPLHRARLRGAAMVIGLVASLFALSVAFVPALHRLPRQDFLLGWAYAAMLFAVVVGPPGARYLFERRALRWVGLISYSFYLWHTAVLDSLTVLVPQLAIKTPQSIISLFVLGFVVCLPVAYLSFLVVERPFFGARKRAHEPFRSEIGK